MSEDNGLIDTLELSKAVDYDDTDIEHFTNMLNELNISHVVQEDNTVVLTFRRIRFDMNGKRAD